MYMYFTKTMSISKVKRHKVTCTVTCRQPYMYMQGACLIQDKHYKSKHAYTVVYYNSVHKSLPQIMFTLEHYATCITCICTYSILSNHVQSRLQEHACLSLDVF